MEYTHLGRSGLTVSRLCLGTLNFGPETPEADAHALMDHAHEHGINFFDTSNVYGGKFGEGQTEQIIGRWIAQGGGRRERTVLATKVYSPMGDWPNDKGLSAFNIRQACDASLKRLQTDHIDLYQMHHPDLSTPWDEVWEAMSHLRAQGKVLYVGSSNFAGWNIAAAQEAALSRHFLGLVSEQSIYNLATRNIELEVIPAAQHYGLGVRRGLRCIAGCSPVFSVTRGRRADTSRRTWTQTVSNSSSTRHCATSLATLRPRSRSRGFSAGPG